MRRPKQSWGGHLISLPLHSILFTVWACLIVLWGLFSPPPLLWAEEAQLSWDPSPSANVTGYKVYHGTASRKYVESFKIENKTSHTLSKIGPGVHYFSVTAYNDFGESAFSDEVSKTITDPPPAVSGTNSGIPDGGSAPAPAASAAGGKGGGGCTLRFPWQEEGTLFDRAEMLLIAFVLLFLAMRRSSAPVSPWQENKTGQRERSPWPVHHVRQ